MDWSELISYDTQSGVAVWKERDLSLFHDLRACKIWNSRFKGKVAGSIHTDDTGRKCLHLSFKNKKYKGHRVFWEIINGSIPNGMTVDHIDQNPLNNKISNLRLATEQEQKRNMPIPKHNSSGVVGVQWDKKAGKWRARIGIDGKSIELGLRDEFSEAVLLRKRAEVNYGFHTNHAVNESAAKLRAGEQP